MKYDKKENEEPAESLAALRERVSKLESLVIEHRRAEESLQNGENELHNILEDIEEGYLISYWGTSQKCNLEIKDLIIIRVLGFFNRFSMKNSPKVKGE